MFIIALLIVIGSILLGLRLGNIGFAFTGGLGVLILTVFMGLSVGSLPVGVVLIILGVICVIATLELSGGLDYMVKIAEKVLKHNPKQINFLAPLAMFIMTFLSGTGNTSYSLIPVIIKVSEEQGIRPVRPLSVTVIAAQIAIVACPMSAATVAMLGFMEPLNVSLLQIIMIMLPSSLLGLFVAAFYQRVFMPNDLKTDEGYIQALKDNLVQKHEKGEEKIIPKGAGLSVLVFLLAVVVVMLFVSKVIPMPKLGSGKNMGTSELILMIMLSAALVITLLNKVKLSQITSQATFKSGVTAALCVIGLAWLGDTLVSNYSDEFKNFSHTILGTHHWMFIVIVALTAIVFYSQSATTLAMMPLGIAMGINPEVLLASYVAVSVLYVLPTSPFVIASVQMDYTGTTRLGNAIINHPFIIPGLITTITASISAYILASIII